MQSVSCEQRYDTVDYSMYVVDDHRHHDDRAD